VKAHDHVLPVGSPSQIVEKQVDTKPNQDVLDANVAKATIVQVVTPDNSRLNVLSEGYLNRRLPREYLSVDRRRIHLTA